MEVDWLESVDPTDDDRWQSLMESETLKVGTVACGVSCLYRETPA